MGWKLNPRSDQYSGGSYSGSGQAKNLGQIQGLIDAAKANEQNFYKMFGPGITNFAQFREFMQQLIQEVEQDKKCLENFHNVNLQKRLGQYMGKYGLALEPTEVIATVKTEGMQIPLHLDKTIKSGIFTIHFHCNDTLKIGMKPNAANLKRLVNDISKDYQYQENQKSRKFQPNRTKHQNAVSSELKSALETIVGADVVQLDMTGVGGSAEAVSFLPETIENPFALSPTQLKDLQKVNPAAYGEVLQAVNHVIENELLSGASDALKTAFRQTWKGVDDLAALFGAGGNLSAGIKGSMGEFGTGLWHQYIAIKLRDKGVSGKGLQFLGQRMENGKQIAIDLGFFNQFGIQVKNINTFAHQTITSSKPLSAIPDQGFQEYVANHVFNVDVPYDAAGAENYVKDHAEEFLNLTLDKATNGLSNNTASFYAVGPNFIPASAIFQSVMQAIQETKVTITGAEGGQGDAYYKQRPTEGNDWFQAKTEGYAEPNSPMSPPGSVGPADFSEGAAIGGRFGAITSSVTIKIEINMHSIISSGAYNVFG